MHKLSTFFRHANTLFIFTLLLIGPAGRINAQELVGDGAEYTIFYTGAAKDYVIPDLSDLGGRNTLELFLKGGDGGSYNGQFQTRKGGGGADIRLTFPVGNSANVLQPGGVIRFVVGEAGDSDFQNGNFSNSGGSGGGGGTAVLYHAPNFTPADLNNPSLDISDAESRWILLGVAGGGGGAGLDLSGDKAQTGTCGSDGRGNRFDGNGGCNGESGDNGDKGTNGNIVSGGGGGTFSEPNQSSFRGRQGGLRGGQGGEKGNDGERGGWGYGGGGGGVTYGGGGGGFSGGGGGGERSSSGLLGGGGGGGSYANPLASGQSITQGNKTNTPNNGKITYTFGAPSDLVLFCRDVEVEVAAGVTTTVTGRQIGEGSYLPGDPNNEIDDFSIVGFPGAPGFPRNININVDNVGSYELTLLAQERDFAARSCAFNLVVIEVTTPVITCVDGPVTVLVDGSGPVALEAEDFVVNVTDPGATAVTTTLNITEVDCSQQELTQVTVTATNDNEFGSSCNVPISVEERYATTISCPANQTLLAEAGACMVELTSASYGPTIDYPQGGTPDFSISSVSQSAENNFVEDPNYTVVSNTLPSTLTLPVGITTVKYTAGNSLSCAPVACQTVIMVVEDLAAICPTEQKDVYLGGGGNVVVGGDYAADIAGNSCGSVTEISNLDSPPSCLSTGSQSFLLRLKDFSGRTEDCVVSVNVIDDVAPVAVCNDLTLTYLDPGTTEVELSELATASTDNCGVANYLSTRQVCNPTCLPTVIINRLTLDCKDIGTQQIKIRAQDASGNQSSCTAQLTVAPTNIPGLVCPAEIVVNLSSPTLTAARVFTATPTSCDPLPDATEIVFLDPFDDSVIGSEVTYACGQETSVSIRYRLPENQGETSCQTTVKVVDDIAPTAGCVSRFAYVSFDGTGPVTIEPSLIGGGNDNCGIVSRTVTPSTVDCADVGRVLVTLTNTDAAGNATSCQRTVVVRDRSEVIAICDDLTLVLDDNGRATIDPLAMGGKSYNLCSAQLNLAPLETEFGCDDLGIHTVELRVSSDFASAVCESQITVVDRTAPVATCQDFTVDFADRETYQLQINDVIESFDENCNIRFNFDREILTCADIHPTPVPIEITIRDLSENSTNCTAMVTVRRLMNCEAAVLPVEWESFTAVEGRKGGVDLRWTTQSETGNRGFYVEHATDDVLWTDVGFVAAASHTGMGQDYTFYHTSPKSGTNLYRLRQTDLDGAISYSAIRTVTTSGGELELYPNPATSEVSLRLPTGYLGSTFSLYRLDGKRLLVGTVSDRTTTLAIDRLPAGVYLLTVNQAGKRLSKRLVIE